MNIDEEELFLKDKLNSARHAVELKKQEIRELTLQKNQLEKTLEDTEQAIIDYMQGNGLLATDNFILGRSYSVDIADAEAVPDEYCRIKTVREPNKILIKEVKPQGNWYSITEKFNIRSK